MSVLKKYWPYLPVGATALVHFLVPSLSAYTATHHNTTVGVLCAAILGAYHLSAPKDQQ